MANLTDLPARTIAANVTRGSLDARVVIDRALERIAAQNPALNALIHVPSARARADAAGIHDRLRAGECLPLAGVPLIVKDNIFVKDTPITQGSRLFEGHVPDEDALSVARARAAGAIIVGIGACPEFASKGFTNTARLGVTRHPLRTDLTPGGSSGGNAAAVRAGFAPVSIGTDGGGSSRRPPAHCGLVGFKPGFGIIPHPTGFAEPFWSITSIAPIARDVADTALLFGVLAGRDSRDPDSRPIAPPIDEPLAALRIAVAPMLGLSAPCDADVLATFQRAINRLAGHAAMEVAHPEWPADMTPAMLMAVQHAGLAALHGEAYRRTPDLFDPDIAAQIERGFTLSGPEVAGALETSLLIRRSVARFFTGHDILISLTTPCTAWPHTRPYPESIGGVPAEPRGHAVLTPMFNHAQTPAISIPCGSTGAGLPVGMQIVGPVGSDWRVLRVAGLIEQILAEG